MPHDLDHDLGSGHIAYCHASLIDPHLHIKFHRDQMKKYLKFRSHLNFVPSSESRDTKTRGDIKNLA